MKSRHLCALASAALLCSLPAASWAEQKTAVILDITGPIYPDVEPFDEVAAGTVLKLATGTELVIGHYKTCDEVTLVGGAISVNEDHFVIDGTDEVTSETGACIGEVELEKTDLVSASIITRSIDEVAKIAPRPFVGIVGSDAAKYTEMSIRRGSDTLLSAPISRQRAQLPDNANALVPGARVVVVLTGPDVEPRAAWVEVSAQAPAWTILRH
jgi:hypothetical protein